MRHIIGAILSFIVAVVLVIFLSTQNIGLIFKPTIEVSNIVELEKCEEGDYIRLEFSDAYLTEYTYGENAKFVDIDVNGQALICIAENKIASKIESKDFETLSIEGVLKDLSSEEAMQGIKQNYIEDFYWELNEEEVLAMFTKLQLVSYNSQKPSIAMVIICSALIVAMIIIAIVCIKKVVKGIGK